MRNGRGTAWIPFAVKPLLLVLALAAAADRCRADPTGKEVGAIAHTLGFVDGIPHIGTVRVAVIFDPVDSVAADSARTTAAALCKTDGPGSASLAAAAVPADALAGAGPVDAFLLMPNAGHFAGAIVQEAQRRHLVTVSSDPQCLADRTCVLWVTAEPRVAVTLDTKLAQSLAVRISPIFAMMVKRR